MSFNDLDAIKISGFMGFSKINELMMNDCTNVPKERGIYFVLNPTRQRDLSDLNVGGHFKGRNPTVSFTELQRNWVEDTLVLYIGKAGGLSSRATLHSRLKQYMRFGNGEPVGHWGGRLIWQLNNNRDLSICWLELPENEPCEIEKSLIREFTGRYGKRPFANLTG